MRFEKDSHALTFFHQGEQLRIEAWGKDSLRVRASMQRAPGGSGWALTEKTEETHPQIAVEEEAPGSKRMTGSITNGRLKAVVNHAGVLSFYKDEQLILREYFRNYDGTISRESRCLKLVNLEWKVIIVGREYALTVKF